jgi:coenzyme PQQ synthesis protein D (PqqD)
MYYTTQVPMLVSQQFDDEVILANLETGIYYSLTGPAADIWLGIQSGATVKEIVAAFVALDTAASETTKQSVTSFVKKLSAEKIIITRENVPDRKPWSPQFSNSLPQPVLERFDDLRELLLLDPVHDVDDAGWPVKAKDAG